MDNLISCFKILLVTTYEAEQWTMNKGIHSRSLARERLLVEMYEENTSQ
jgi:hypothetical protein